MWPIAALTWCGLAAGATGQEVFFFVDDHGVDNYSNVPNDPRYTLVPRAGIYLTQAHVSPAAPPQFAEEELVEGDVDVAGAKRAK